MRGRYVAKRAAQLIPMVLAVVIINFLIIHLTPGDPASAMAGENASTDYVEQLRHQYGLDRALPIQLVVYLGHLLRGDLGYSFAYQTPVLNLILERLPATLLLLAASQIPAIILGVGLGALSGRFHNKWPDRALSVVTLTLYSIPVFWSGMLLILGFAIHLHWLPPSGMTDYASDSTGLAHVGEVLAHLILPAVSLMLYSLPTYVRLTRASLVEVLREPYIKTARVMGFAPRRVFNHYALRNALLPTVTQAGLSLGFMFAGALLTETVFAWPGMGSLMYSAVFQRDYPTVMGVFLFTAICIAIMGLVTDIIYAILDPRVSYE
jgi:peptide/nickel transport system permease protein